MANSQDCWIRATAAFDRGDMAAARAESIKLLETESASPRLHWLLGSIELNSRRFKPALRHAFVASAGAAGLAPLQLTAVTRLLISLGEFEPAHKLLSGLGTGPALGAALVPIGEQMLMLEQYDSALAALTGARSRGIRHPMVSYLLSNAWKFTGNLDLAKESAEDVLQQQPGFVHAHWSLAQMGDVDGAGQRIDRIRREVATLQAAGHAHPGAVTALSVLSYALFRELDRIEDIDAAWQALSAGMQLRRQLRPHSIPDEDALFDRLLDTYTGEFVTQQAELPLGPQPIFVVGMPRSGTTLVARIIGNHPEVANCGELNELQLLVKRTIGYWCPEFIDDTCVAALATAELSELGNRYLRDVAWRTQNKPWLVDKHQSNFMLAGVILRCLPQARIIHMRRSPMDTCFSNLKELFSLDAYSYSNNQADCAHHFRNYSRLMAQLHRVAPGRILDVCYEDLVASPDHVTRNLMDFIGLAYQEDLPDITRNVQPVATASSVQVRSALHSRNVGGWQRYARHLGELERTLFAGES